MGFAASVLKEKLSSLGSSGVLADHQLQSQLQEHHQKGLVGIDCINNLWCNDMIVMKCLMQHLYYFILYKMKNTFCLVLERSIMEYVLLCNA